MFAAADQRRLESPFTFNISGINDCVLHRSEHFLRLRPETAYLAFGLRADAGGRDECATNLIDTTPRPALDKNYLHGTVLRAASGA